MIKLTAPASIEKIVQNSLDKIPVCERSDMWDGKPKEKAKPYKPDITSFKTEVMDHGMKLQSQKCAWCTLPIGKSGRRSAQRDHIAPKSTYPQWTFNSKNIVIVCEYCNGFSVKNNLDTVAKSDPCYDKVKFKLIHPYLDDPKGKISFVEEEIGDDLGVVIRGHTPEAVWMIEKLKLDDPGLTLERAKELSFYERKKTLPFHFQTLLEQATGRT